MGGLGRKLNLWYSQPSFEHVQEWLAEVNSYAPETTVKMLVGNKADLKDQKKVDDKVAQVLRIVSCYWRYERCRLWFRLCSYY